MRRKRWIVKRRPYDMHRQILYFKTESYHIKESYILMIKEAQNI